jgi:serine/threonine protein phosphatase PrpC
MSAENAPWTSRVSPEGEVGFVNVRAWGISDVGRQRTVNQDCHYIDPDHELILVLDGMGGHRAGEVASQMAMETITRFYKENSAGSSPDPGLIEDYDKSFTFHTNLLRQAVLNANRAVLDESWTREEYLGMGSTVTGMAIHDYTVSVINVGDSRMYLIREGIMEQISKDHTLAEDQVERGIMTREEARESQLRHILSSVIGVDGRIRVHVDELSVVSGDIFLLCTDGLSAVMEDKEILSFLLANDLGQQTLTRLIDEVNERGGPDNTTLALTVFSEEPTSSKQSSVSAFLSKALGVRKK